MAFSPVRDSPGLQSPAEEESEAERPKGDDIRTLSGVIAKVVHQIIERPRGRLLHPDCGRCVASLSDVVHDLSRSFVIYLGLTGDVGGAWALLPF